MAISSLAEFRTTKPLACLIYVFAAPLVQWQVGGVRRRHALRGGALQLRQRGVHLPLQASPFDAPRAFRWRGHRHLKLVYALRALDLTEEEE